MGQVSTLDGIDAGGPERKGGGAALIARILERAGMQVNGPNEFDPQIHDDRFYSRVLRSGGLGLGESYMDGWWDVAQLDVFFDKLLRARAEYSVRPIPLLLLNLRSRLFNMQTPFRSLRVAREHYEIGNDFYTKMLDPWMQYTSAYYERTDDLNRAQEDKLELVCRKIRLSASDTVLDLGCGFGGFVKYAAERYGAKVVGYNIAGRQVQFGREATKGLNVEIRQEDYRNAYGSFDKVVAIGLLEHVGYKNYKALMAVAHRCLKPGGLFLLNNVGGNREAVTTDPWLERYIFPGSVMPSPAQFAKSFEPYFVLESWENNGLDYDRTCVAWFENVQRNWDEIRTLDPRFDERFFRMWKYYLLVCAGSFRARKNQNWEAVLSKGTLEGGWRRPSL